jgi:hypothetical protein
MTETTIEDLLAEHADALNRNEALNETFLAEHPEYASEAVPLFQLAAALKAALTPVSAPVFKTRLGQELVSYGPPVIVLGRSVTKRRNKAWLALAAAGSVISVAGLTALLLHRVRGVEKRAPRQTSLA